MHVVNPWKLILRQNTNLKKSMFLVSFPHSIINDDGTMKFYSYVNHYVKADLSYMDDMKIGIT